MKRILVAIMMIMALVALYISCVSDQEPSTLKLALVTDYGTVNDRSYNQGIWEGLKKAGEDQGVEVAYLRPLGTTTVDGITAISDLYDAGYRFITCPCHLFVESIEDAQEMFPDLMLVLFDFSTTGPPGPNTLSIFFDEHEAGFLAGLATALQLKEASAGFIGGISLSAVQKYNWGFQQGIAYANEHYGTDVVIEKNNVVYAGTFTDFALGSQLANTMFESGVDVIFACGGSTGIGVINEAKTRRVAGEDVWAVGVDVDQYYIGEMGDGHSAILTSALKKISQATYDEAVKAINGTFQGGESVSLGVAEGAVGIPEENPNLSAETEAEVRKVAALIKDGTVKVRDTSDGLIP